MQPSPFRRQAEPLDAAVVRVDLALDEPELLGAVDVVGDRRAVDVLVAGEERWEAKPSWLIAFRTIQMPSEPPACAIACSNASRTSFAVKTRSGRAARSCYRKYLEAK